MKTKLFITLAISALLPVSMAAPVLASDAGEDRNLFETAGKKQTNTRPHRGRSRQLSRVIVRRRSRRRVRAGAGYCLPRKGRCNLHGIPLHSRHMA